MQVNGIVGQVQQGKRLSAKNRAFNKLRRTGTKPSEGIRQNPDDREAVDETTRMPRRYGAGFEAAPAELAFLCRPRAASQSRSLPAIDAEFESIAGADFRSARRLSPRALALWCPPWNSPRASEPKCPRNPSGHS